ncbi:MAG: hypothetical protein HY689_11275 [Chloroflexi bacterium]|nr:hypothetical protein [Chloroflexota bacterium]
MRFTAFSRQRAPWKVLFLATGLALVVSACSQSSQASSSQPAAQQAQATQQLQAKDQEIATLKTQLAATQKDAKYWSQLTTFLKPVEMKSMTDHRAFMTPGGVVVALHFDHMNLDQAQNLNWVAVGLPGKNCKEDQERLEQTYGKGFTHFHDMQKDTHGGDKGAEGLWFIHMAVRDLDSPMSGGKVTAGPDLKFMPTPVQSGS